MNLPGRRTTLGVGAFLIVLTTFFPPWRSDLRGGSMIYEWGLKSTTINSPIFSPPVTEPIRVPGQGTIGAAEIDFFRLLRAWIVIGAITAAVYIVQRRREERGSAATKDAAG